MPMTAERGTAAGKTNLIAAVNATNATTACAVVSVDISDIISAVGLSNAEKRAQAMRRLLEVFERGVTADPRSDAEINQQVTAAQARAAAEIAARPAGSL